MECKKPEVQYVGDLPIDNLESVADYFLAERDILDQATGNTVRSFVRVPGNKLFPTANMDNVAALVPNSDRIVIPEDQVRAVYIANDMSMPVMYYAENADHATMLAVGNMADMVLVQSTGFINIPNGHKYIVGVEYYAGKDGEPVTDSASGLHLFTPVSSTKLLVDIRATN